jgi:hypothetical protein
VAGWLDYFRFADHTGVGRTGYDLSLREALLATTENYFRFDSFSLLVRMRCG